MPTILAEATRGDRVESVHHGTVVVADVTGAVVAVAGDPDRFAYFRSSAKPFQAIPVVESGAADAFAFTPAELALACASHNAEPRHQSAVAAMLAKVGLGPDALACGCPLPSDPAAAARVVLGLETPSPLGCDCSGKHAAMLATCVHLGEPTAGYLDPQHPAQRRVKRAVAAALRLPETDLLPATDGCGLPTFGAPLRHFAVAFATLAAPAHAPANAGLEHAPALDRLRAAMTAHPENVAGAGDLVTDLMAVTGGPLAAKSGAEGLLCLALPEQRLGVAIRIADGSFRAHPAVAFAVLEQLALLDPPTLAELRRRHPPAIRNHAGRHVGELRPTFTLQPPPS